MEVCYHFCSIVKVLCVLPGVVLYSVALPFDQVLESTPEHPTVQDFFHNVFFFTVNEFWRRWRSCTSSSNGVGGARVSLTMLNTGWRRLME